jgi:carboxyl-terminal processing protease
MPRSSFRPSRLVVRRLLVGGSLLLVGALAGFVAQPERLGARLLNRTLSLVSQHAPTAVPDDSLLIWAARGVVRELRDPYAALYSAAELAAFQRESLRSSYAGLGVTILSVRGQTRIGGVFSGSPAAALGIEAGSRIVRVDDWSVGTMPTDSVVSHLLGPVGTTVRVAIEPRLGGAVRDYRVTRGRIRPAAVPFVAELDGAVGYIPLRTFNDRSAADVLESVSTLRARGAQRFVLDLRDNAGGSVEQAIDVAGVFLPGNRDVLLTRSRGGGNEMAQTRVDGPALTEPLVVLIDDGSASASEIVAGALQDHDRALVVGTTSFGKGLVQSVFPMDSGYALKFTTARWFTPLGRPLHRERHLTADDRLVADRADSVEAIDDTLGRPAFRTAAGRTVYGGGGIVPDVIARPDTLTAPDIDLIRALGARSTLLQSAAFDLARTLPVPTDRIVVTDGWRAQLLATMRADGARISDEQFSRARSIVDYVLTQQIARLHGGEQMVFANLRDSDRPLSAARARLAGSTTTRALLAGVRTGRDSGT